MMVSEKVSGTFEDLGHIEVSSADQNTSGMYIPEYTSKDKMKAD